MSKHVCIDAYEDPDNLEMWSKCPECDLKPKIWTFDNGMFTACGCGENKYRHLSIRSESVMSVYKRTGMTAEYKGISDLLKAWNSYCETGIVVELKKGRW